MLEESEILSGLRQAVIDGDDEQAGRWATTALEADIDPLLAFDALTAGIREIGDAFARGELYLPDLLMSADAMKVASAILEDQIKDKGAARRSTGKVVIGTVFGDIHNIGKNMVATLLKAAGFEVLDLGINVRSEEFVSAVKTFQPDILAMSALLTTTAPEQERVIDALTQAGLRGRVQVIVGGGGITREFARRIGADGFDATAPGAVQLALGLAQRPMVTAHG
jgi:methanogenic corrinoid protein MtbC1